MSSSSVVFDSRRSQERTENHLRPSDSPSIKVQIETERECKPYFADLTQLAPDQVDHLRQTGLLPSNENNFQIQLLREKHVEYLSQVWKRNLKAPFVSLDASRPWMLYWCLHGCDLLDAIPSDHERFRMVTTLEHCFTVLPITWEHPVTKSEDAYYYFTATNANGDDDEISAPLEAGGFGGGPGQLAHAATTYAAILSLCIVGTAGGESGDRALEFLQRIRWPMYRWMVQLLHQESGGFSMHRDGEVDVRASYTILCCAKLLDIATPTLCGPNVVKFIQQCQTYEGGLGGEPWSEAHGGYAYCGVSALQLLGKLHVLDLPSLTGWLCRRQMAFEGGFSGRSNKLVDGCYSFWQGGAVALTSAMYQNHNNHNNNNQGESSSLNDGDIWLSSSNSSSIPPPLLFDAPMLERYILLCAQDVHGGLRDKPSKSRDFYHSCYNLSGLSIAQHYNHNNDNGGDCCYYGDPQQTKLGQTHPCYNIRVERVKRILNHKWQ